MRESKPRILFTEDHEDTRDLIKLVLQCAQYEVTTTDTAAEALNLARSETFNLFIFDSWLPDGSGLELCKQVRAFDAHTPILFYSGVGQENDVKLAFSSGVQAYLVKPVEIPQLLETIEALMAGQKESVKALSRLPTTRASQRRSATSGELL